MRGGGQGFESMEVRDLGKETTECVGRSIVCTLVSSTPFSKHLMILNRMVVSNSIML